MGELRYKIGHNDSINRWWIGEVAWEAFSSPCETFDAQVNPGEAYVQIVYPVRREFLKENRIGKVKYFEGSYSTVYFPFENNRVDFTTFIHTPHYLHVNAITQVFAGEAGEYPFELCTCGGMKLWVNKEEFVTFAPYTRNIPGKRPVSLPLRKGLNEIAVYADELAERDVFFYFEMRYKGDKEIIGVVQMDVDAEEVARVESFLRSCHFPRDLVTEGRLVLKFDSSCLDKETRIFIEGDEAFTKLNNVRLGCAHETVINRNTERIDLGSIDTFNIGMFRVFVCCSAGGFMIRRELVVGIIPRSLTAEAPAATLGERKRQALDFICDFGENVVNRTMTILEQKKEMTVKAMECLAASLEKIEAKEDCADFYLPPMLLLMTRYREYLCDETYDRIARGVLNFRYWIDEPGNDVMWYFSENHALLFHIGQYLAGFLFADREFTVSRRKGTGQYEAGKHRVEKWFETFERYGYAEWNSATYIPVDLIGFFTLYMMAPDKHIRDAARRALDFTFKLIAYNNYSGIMGCSYGRAYEETLKGRPLVEPNFLSWITWGEGYLTSASRAAALYCLSDYSPPDFKEEVRLQSGEWMSAELDQGENCVKTYYFRTNDYFTACVRRFRPFVHGHQQHLMNVALSARGVQYYINHPGERMFSGGNRPAYWAGNGTMPFIEQYGNVILLLYRIDPEELVHYIHAYTPFYEYDECETTEHWLFLRAEDSYIGTFFSNGFIKVTGGANAGKEVVSHGLNHGLVVKCGSKREFGSFRRFQEQLRQALIRYDGNEWLSFNDPQYGPIEIMGIDDVRVKSEPLEYNAAPAMVVKRGMFGK